MESSIFREKCRRCLVRALHGVVDKEEPQHG